MDETAKMFTAYDIQSCLYDEARVDLFQRAIAQTVGPESIVVDGGSGTGLLGLLAARQGARRVYCVELNPEYVEVIRQNAERNGLSDRVVAVHADATTWQAPEPVDVIISEVISAGFFYEPQLQIVDNLRQSLRHDGQIIPLAMQNRVGLISAQQHLYGLRFDYDSRFRSLPGDVPLSTSMPYLTTAFDNPGDPSIRETVTVEGISAGIANAVRVDYSIEFTKGEWADTPTEFLMNPQIIFLPSPVEVEERRDYRVTLDYQASTSPVAARISVDPLPAKRSPAPSQPIAEPVLMGARRKASR